jgi:hypothetical protein
MTTDTAFADKVEAFINNAWDKGLTVFVSRPIAAAKIKPLLHDQRATVLRRAGNDIYFGYGKRCWKLCPADHIAARKGR